MKRLLETSAGSSLVTLRRDAVAGKSVTLETFDAAGWEVGGKTWSTRYGYHDRSEPLHEFLAVVLKIPAHEAAAVAAEIEGQWFNEYESRGGLDEDRKVEKIGSVVIAVAASLIVLAFVGVALLLWLVVQ
jgi:hypothetical protein